MSQSRAGRSTRGRGGASTPPPSHQPVLKAQQQNQLFELQLAKAAAENAAIEQASASAALFAEQQRTFAAEKHAAEMAHQAALRAVIVVGPQQAPV